MAQPADLARAAVMANSAPHWQRHSGAVGGGELSFISVYLAPGDIVSLLIGEQVRTPAIEAAIRAEWGLDQPLWLQYLHYLWRVLHGDFGRSYLLNIDVSSLVLSQLWRP
ncbi:Dipeptide transport system permease protein dppB [Ewingella americana]|uniref:Dipeptide transport system permease protein dppB n=1 Tax=Ewingella americana TaxID=41202 RepID=A0A377TC71_9GAMM|nr:Dipeptide transport system permease protein dppB [Ewingella americana]